LAKYAAGSYKSLAMISLVRVASLLLFVSFAYAGDPGEAAPVLRAINGFTVRGSVDEVQTFRKMGGDGPDVARVPQWKQAGGQCAKDGISEVRCLLASLLGGEASADTALRIRMQYGYAVFLIPAADESVLQSKWSESVWQESELTALARMLGEMPAQFHNLPTLEQFVRVPADPDTGGFSGLSYRPENQEGVHVPGGISLELPPMDRMVEAWGAREVRRLFAHELSHHFAYNHIPIRQAFDRIGGSFVSDYAKTNAYEDFAESASFYRYFPAKLKAAAPAKYQFLKAKVFFGQEYLNEDPSSD
jgi:hypothetical protein